MKRFFIKLSVYVGYIFIFWTCILLFNLCSGFSKLYSEKKVVILGDSHAKTAINPKAISKNAINYSQFTEPFMFTYFKLKKIHNDIGLDTVMLSLGPHSFSSINDRKFTDARWSTTMFSRGYRLLILEELDMLVDKKSLYRTWFKKMVLWPNHDQTEYLGTYTPKNPENSPRLSKSDIDKSIKKHYYYDSEALVVSNLQLAYFKKITTFCSREGINLVIVAPPVHIDYLTLVPEPFIVTYDSIINSYKDSILVLDMLRLSVPDSFFQDGDHVNELGANLVGDSIQKILVKKPTNISADGF